MKHIFTLLFFLLPIATAQAQVNEGIKEEIRAIMKDKYHYSVYFNKELPADCYVYERDFGSAHGQDFLWVYTLVKFKSGWLGGVDATDNTLAMVNNLKVTSEGNISFDYELPGAMKYKDSWLYGFKGTFNGTYSEGKLSGTLTYIEDRYNAPDTIKSEEIRFKHNHACFFDIADMSVHVGLGKRRPGSVVVDPL